MSATRFAAYVHTWAPTVVGGRATTDAGETNTLRALAFDTVTHQLLVTLVLRAPSAPARRTRYVARLDEVLRAERRTATLVRVPVRGAGFVVDDDPSAPATAALDLPFRSARDARTFLAVLGRAADLGSLVDIHTP